MISTARVPVRPIFRSQLVHLVYCFIYIPRGRGGKEMRLNTSAIQASKRAWGNGLFQRTRINRFTGGTYARQIQMDSSKRAGWHIGARWATRADRHSVAAPQCGRVSGEHEK